MLPDESGLAGEDVLSPAQLALAVGGQSPPRISELAQRVEAAGVSRLLISEQAGGPDAFSLTAFLLGHTKRIAVGPGLVSALDRHPLVLARQAATCDRLAPGRTLLGLGRSSRHYIEDVLNLPYRPATKRMEEAVSLVAELLSGREVSFQGEFLSLDHSRLDPGPASPIPLLLGASGDQTLRMAGRLADAALLNGGASCAYVGWARSAVTLGSAQSARAPGAVQIGAWCLMAVEADGRWTPGLDRLRRQLAEILLEPDSGHSLVLHSGLGEDETGRLLRARSGGENAIVQLLEDWDILRRLAVVGSRKECWRRLEEYLLAGADYIVLQPAAMGTLLSL